MPTIVFVVETPSGIENDLIHFDIPDQGNLPEIPFEWNGKGVARGSLVSGAWRTWKGDRQFSTVETERATLVWIEERKEWVAFSEKREKLPTGGWYYDESISLLGPWRLNESYIQALKTAFPDFASIPNQHLIQMSPSDLEMKEP